MASTINFSALTFSTEEIRDLNELLFKSIVEADEFQKFHSILTGIKYDREIGRVGEFGLVGKAGQGCSPTSDTFTLSVTKKTWQPKVWEIIRDECFTDLNSTLAIYAKKFGTEEPDLTGTAYMDMVQDKLRVAIQKMLWRIAWFNDTAAATVDDSPAGTLTSGTSAAYFNLLNGFWKQIDVIFAATPARRGTIAANSQATKALQWSAFTSTLAYGYAQDMVYNCTPELRAASNKVALCTRSFVDKLEQYLMSKSIVPAYDNEVNGFNSKVSGLKLLGISWYPIDIWDEIINAYYNNGSALYRPHRAVLTTKDQLMIGVPSTSILENVDISFFKESRKNRVEVRDQIDAKIAEDHMIQVAL